LLACAKEAVDMFSIAASDDAGAHFTPLLHLADVIPAADCPASSSAGICLSKWPPIAATIGADAGAPLALDGGAKPTKSNGGCGCDLGSPAREQTAAIGLTSALALVLTRRRGRRAQGAVQR
jgi:hypothetical protein